jgi:hypothetical protein
MRQRFDDARLPSREEIEELMRETGEELEELAEQGGVSVNRLYGFEQFNLQSHRPCSLHGSPRHSSHRWRPAAHREVVTSHGP